MTREELENGRHRYNPHRVYGYKFSYCEHMKSCEECKENDKKIYFACQLINKIEDCQEKRILKICK